MLFGQGSRFLAVLVATCVPSVSKGLIVTRYPIKACTTPGSSSRFKSNSRLSAVGIRSEASTGKKGSPISEEKFNWQKAWYPVLSEADSDPKRAHAVQLLGKDLVVWRNSEGRWATFDDRCPHRAAPLTEGRVEKDGSLLCSYHAWRFDADGKCLSIPQSDRGGKDEANPKACAMAYPTQVAQDIVWVWGENGPDAALESLLSQPPLVSALEDEEGIKEGRVVRGALMQRDLTYSWEAFLENALDPAHVVVSHHGVMGKRSMAKPLSLEATPTPALTKDGFSFDNNSPQFGAKQGVTTFYPPSTVEIVTERADGVIVTLIQYNIPTKPGWSRLISRQMTTAPKSVEKGGERDGDVSDADKDLGGTVPTTKKKKKAPSLLKMATRISPVKLKLSPMEQRRWIQHVMFHIFVAQDLPLLHHQEKILAGAGHTGSKWSAGMFTPTKSDQGVLTLHQWIAKFGSGGPPWAVGCNTSLPPREHNQDIVFDIYQTHTKDCTACLGALKRVEQCIVGAKVSTVLSLAWAVLNAAVAVGTSAAVSMAPGAPVAPRLSLANPVLVKSLLPGVLVGLLGLWATKKLGSLRNMFHVFKYVHQDHD